jgi:indole-3-glycerol phosphate synthase
VRDEPLSALRRRAKKRPPPPPLTLDSFDLFAEVKLASPSSRRESTVANIGERVAAYASAGAAAVSVLTEPTCFQGSLADLREAARAAGRVPAMRKDFLVDPYQVYEARAAGAGGVLLIAELCEDDRQLRSLLDCARECGLFVLLEAFDEPSLRRAMRFRAPDVLLGVNCRDLRNLSVDPGRFATMANYLGAGPIVAESGLHGARDVEQVAKLGYPVALVGTALMRAQDPGSRCAAMIAAGRRVRCASA